MRPPLWSVQNEKTVSIGNLMKFHGYSLSNNAKLLAFLFLMTSAKESLPEIVEHFTSPARKPEFLLARFSSFHHLAIFAQCVGIGVENCET